MTQTPSSSILPALATALVLLGGLGVGPLRADADTDPSARAATLVLDQRDGKDVLVDAPPRGGIPTVGDTFVTSNHLLDPTTGEPIGRTHQECVTTQVMRKPLDAVADCTLVLVTSDGSLTLHAAWLFSADSQELAVTGGTGTYAGASGTATWTSGKGEASTWTVELQ